jgi:hypothetical protein
MTPFPPNLNSQRPDSETEARIRFAELIAALASVVHSPPEPLQDKLPKDDPLTAATKLRACWDEAMMLCVPRASLGPRLPLPTPQSLGLLRNLLAIAAYSGWGVERMEAAVALLWQLAEAMHTPEIQPSGEEICEV